ncbi:MAG: HlyD family efflux transporter periplasmic adaptor subunit [Thermodesulfobacteriota bacterium]
MKKRVILIFFLVLLLGVGTLVYLGQHRKQTAELYYSGTIEATQANLSFQVSGKVAQVFIDEGQPAEKDQCLARLADEEFSTLLNQRQTELIRSQETLKQLQALRDLYQATLPAEVERATATVGLLSSQLEELESGYRTQEIEQARLTARSAQAVLDEARRNKERFDALYQKRVIAEKEKDLVDLKYETALKDYERAQAAHSLLKEGFRKESIQAAKARLSEGRATLKQARSNLKKIEAAEKEVAAARAMVETARAAVDLAKIQLGYTCLTAPFKGTLTSRNVEPGEVVSPGREVLTLADLSTVELKIFVDEPEIGKVKPGQRVEIRTDTYPQKIYPGQVSFISPEAEFTPKIIQTHKERVKLVYLVKIAILNPDLELKPGMPADAWLR